MSKLIRAACDMQDRLSQIERLARNANFILQEVQEDYFECNNINDERSFIPILNGFERNGVKVDIVSDIVVAISELADFDESKVADDESVVSGDE